PLLALLIRAEHQGVLPTVRSEVLHGGAVVVNRGIDFRHANQHGELEALGPCILMLLSGGQVAIEKTGRGGRVGNTQIWRRGRFIPDWVGDAAALDALPDVLPRAKSGIPAIAVVGDDRGG